MRNYSKRDARAWARQNLTGLANVVIPSYTADLKGLNEAGIRHDVRRCIELGFAGTLLVSETAITVPEYEQFFAWANDEARGKLMLIHHASWNTFEENIEAVRVAERNGAELVLMSYPANFYPDSIDDVISYTAAYCDATDLAVLLFPVPLWGFDRLHPSDIPVAAIRTLLDRCPNIVAIKAEGNMPSIMGFVECYRHFGQEVIVTCPLEKDLIALAQLVPIQFSGTSNFEYFGDAIPKIFNDLQAGRFDEATEHYWRLSPARKAQGMAGAHTPQTLFIHRMLWKYQAWLNGFNGGPLRAPTMRINDGMMNALRNGLVASGIAPAPGKNRDFFIGRNPVETAAAALAAG